MYTAHTEDTYIQGNYAIPKFSDDIVKKLIMNQIKIRVLISRLFELKLIIQIP